MLYLHLNMRKSCTEKKTANRNRYIYIYTRTDNSKKCTKYQNKLKTMQNTHKYTYIYNYIYNNLAFKKENSHSTKCTRCHTWNIHTYIALPYHTLLYLTIWKFRVQRSHLGNPQDTSIELQPVAFEQSPLTAVGAERSLSTTGQDTQSRSQEDVCELPLYAALLDLSDLPCRSEGFSGEQRWPQQPWSGTCLSTDSYLSMVPEVAKVAYTVLRRRSCSCSETKE